MAFPLEKTDNQPADRALPLHAEPGTSSWKGLLLGAVLVFVVSTSVLMGLVYLIDNTGINTTNGLWKSTLMEQWYTLHPDRYLDASNLLYYPVNAGLLHLFPEQVFGPIWKRMAYLNTAYAGLCLAFLYVLMRGLGISRFASVCAVMFQMGCSFFLILAITNEDIMPAITFLVGAIALAVHLLEKPTTLRIILVAQLFVISWSFEWRVMFPAVPSFGLMLLALPGPWRLRLKRVALFAAGSLILPVCWVLLTNEMGFPQPLSRIFWTGKAVDSGYAGFSTAKIQFMFCGICQYVYKGLNIGSLAWMHEPSHFRDLVIVGSFVSVMGVFFLVGLVRNWSHLGWRIGGVLLGSSFLFGEFFNLYSQPQDPQMQMNVMMWTAAAWGIACAWGLSLIRRYAVAQRVLLGLVSLAPLGLTLKHIAPMRGEDDRAEQRVKRLEAQFDPHKTVFISNGFEGLNSWQAISWGHVGYNHLFPLPEGETPYYKPVYLLDEGTSYPRHSPEESAQVITGMIDQALRSHYTVVINYLWDFSEAEFADSWATVCGPEKPQAIYRSLKEHYEGRLVYQDPDLGAYYELRPKAQGSAASEVEIPAELN